MTALALERRLGRYLRTRRLERGLALAGHGAPEPGCLGCLLVRELVASPGPAESRAREAASYATTASLCGCPRCGSALDLLCEAGLYR